MPLRKSEAATLARYARDADEGNAMYHKAAWQHWRRLLRRGYIVNVLGPVAPSSQEWGGHHKNRTTYITHDGLAALEKHAARNNHDS